MVLTVNEIEKRLAKHYAEQYHDASVLVVWMGGHLPVKGSTVDADVWLDRALAILKVEAP